MWRAQRDRGGESNRRSGRRCGAQLIELTPERRTRSRNSASRNISFSIAWQSSNVPSMATALTFAASTVVIMRALHLRDAPFGNSTISATLTRPRNASTAAPPVSPEVAQTMVRRSPRQARGRRAAPAAASPRP